MIFLSYCFMPHKGSGRRLALIIKNNVHFLADFLQIRLLSGKRIFTHSSTFTFHNAVNGS